MLEECTARMISPQYRIPARPARVHDFFADAKADLDDASYNILCEAFLDDSEHLVEELAITRLVPSSKSQLTYTNDVGLIFTPSSPVSPMKYLRSYAQNK